MTDAAKPPAEGEELPKRRVLCTDCVHYLPPDPPALFIRGRPWAVCDHPDYRSLVDGHAEYGCDVMRQGAAVCGLEGLLFAPKNGAAPANNESEGRA